MTIQEIRVKSILSKSKVFDYTINPYVGCQHGCFYCYARFIKRFTGHKEKWGEFVDVKINAPEVLIREIKKRKKGTVWISGICDPYQPLEKKYELTKKCLEILKDHKWSVVIQTKSILVLRDIEIFKKFKDIRVGFSIPTADEEIRKIFEPRAPSVKKRIKALEILHRENIKTYAMIAPVLPGAEGLVRELKGKVDYVIIDKMNYHYADGIYKKYGLKKEQNIYRLAELFEKENVLCEVVC